MGVATWFSQTYVFSALSGAMVWLALGDNDEDRDLFSGVCFAHALHGCVDGGEGVDDLIAFGCVDSEAADSFDSKPPLTQLHIPWLQGSNGSTGIALHPKTRAVSSALYISISLGHE